MVIKNFPGVYNNKSVPSKVTGITRNTYWDELLGNKLDKKHKPKSVYAVDENGNQIMISFEELGLRDAPKDGNQYARENGTWDKVDTYSYKITNVVVYKTNWTASTELGSDYLYEYSIIDPKITENFIPDVIFSEKESTLGLFSPIAKTENGYVTIYSRKIPESDFIIPLILFE
jgi:hypothetical protein